MLARRRFAAKSVRRSQAMPHIGMTAAAGNGISMA
jgi:hypothetical protein